MSLDFVKVPDDLTLDDLSMDGGFPGPDLSDLAAAEPHEIDVRPTGYNLLIEIPERSDKTLTGIYRPEEYRVKEQVASVLALVLEVGPEAYKDRDRFPAQTPWCKAGDFILIHPYTGSRFQFKQGETSREYRILEDRHVLAVVSRRALPSVDRVNAA